MNTFQELGLSEELLQAITELGFTTPTEIQQKAIPIFLKQEKDLVALAQTGTGKTAAFGLPILQNIDTNSKNTQALIVSPTRELCMQITNDLKNYSKHIRGINIVAVYGGASISLQIKDIKRGAQIIVATPGRLIDLLDRKAVKIDEIHTVVLDEADEMLNMGFQEDIESILSYTPENKTTGLFSATMPSEIRKIANQYLREHEEVSVGKKNTASAQIAHQYAVVHAKDKRTALKRIIDFNDDFYAIVFCQTKIETQEISDQLIKDGYNADCLHGDLSQQQRDKVMNRFRNQTVKILLATDVAARGIDVSELTHVIHYSLPDDIENYTHRSGRTGRAGKKGTSIALLNMRETFKIKQIEKLAGVKVERFTIPGGQEILMKRLNHYIQHFTHFNIEEEKTMDYDNEAISPLMAMDKEEIINRLLTIETKKFGIDLMNNQDINAQESARDRERSGEAFGGRDRRRGSDRERGSRGGDDDANVRMFINLGKKDGIRYDEMRDLIFSASKVAGRNIKDIDFSGVYSFFQTDEQSAQRIEQAFKENVEYKGREVRIQKAGEQKEGGSDRNERPARFGGDRNAGGRSGGGFKGERNERPARFGGDRNTGGRSDRADRQRSESDVPKKKQSVSASIKERNAEVKKPKGPTGVDLFPKTPKQTDEKLGGSELPKRARKRMNEDEKW